MSLLRSGYKENAASVTILSPWTSLSRPSQLPCHEQPTEGPHDPEPRPLSVATWRSLEADVLARWSLHLITAAMSCCHLMSPEPEPPNQATADL